MEVVNSNDTYYFCAIYLQSLCKTKHSDNETGGGASAWRTPKHSEDKEATLVHTQTKITYL